MGRMINKTQRSYCYFLSCVVLINILICCSLFANDTDYSDDLVSRKRIAFLIGNWDYATEESRLNSPQQDVYEMEKVLEELNFDRIYLFENPTREETIRALQKMREESKGAMIFFYYSGHAIEVQGQNWLIPPDAHIKDMSDVPLSGLSVSQILNLLDDAHLRVLILDACRNNPFRFGGKSLGSGGLGRDRLSGLEGTLISYAAAPGTIAYDGQFGGLSPYTEALVEQLRVPGLDLPNLFMNVRGELIEKTKNGSRGPQRSEEVNSLVRKHQFFFSEAIPAQELVANKSVQALTENVQDQKIKKRVKTFKKEKKTALESKNRRIKKKERLKKVEQAKKQDSFSVASTLMLVTAGTGLLGAIAFAAGIYNYASYNIAIESMYSSKNESDYSAARSTALAQQDHYQSWGQTALIAGSIVFGVSLLLFGGSGIWASGGEIHQME